MIERCPGQELGGERYDQSYLGKSSSILDVGRVFCGYLGQRVAVRVGSSVPHRRSGGLVDRYDRLVNLATACVASPRHVSPFATPEVELPLKDLRDRVLRRWLEAGEVVPFGKPSKAPRVEIAGSSYALSDDGGPLSWGEELGDEEGGPGTGHARLIRGPSHGSKWKYLWVYDTDRQTIAMWRVTDGNEKVYDSARSEMHRIVRLDRRGQLNRIDHATFLKIDVVMKKIEAENFEALQKSIEDNKSEYQAAVDELAQEFFQKFIVPKIEKVIHDIDAGASPFGFKPHSADLPQRRQMVVFVISRITAKEFTIGAVEAYLRTKGIDPEAPGHDNQAAQWAIGDIVDAAYEKYT